MYPGLLDSSTNAVLNHPDEVNLNFIYIFRRFDMS